MAVDIQGIAQVQTDVPQDDATGVLVQAPEGTRSTPGGLSDTPPATGQNFYGQPFILGCRVGIAVNSPAAATTYRATLLNKNAPCALKILEVTMQVVDLSVAEFTDADGGNLDVTVIRGDGDASETESDVLADFTMDDDFANGETIRWPDQTTLLANTEIVEGGSLYVDLVVEPDATAGATNDGAVVDVWVTCVKINS